MPKGVQVRPLFPAPNSRQATPSILKKYRRGPHRAVECPAQMPDKFKCPKCGSGRTKPLSMAIAAGTRRRRTVGVSRRSLWTSSSTYKSDLVASLPQRPSNAGAYLLIFLGVCGLLLTLVVMNNPNQSGVTIFLAVVSILLLLAGYFAKTPANQLSQQQESWDNKWLCARCGHQWNG